MLNQYAEIIDGLWMGSFPENWGLVWDSFDAVVSLVGISPYWADKVSPIRPPEGKIHVIWPIEDGYEVPNITSLTAVVSLMCKLVAEGKNVLVHCAAGLDRSGLVCAMALCKFWDCSGTEAIDAVQRERGPLALSNSAFKTFLKQQYG